MRKPGANKTSILAIARALARAARAVVPRVYAVGIMAIILFLTFYAVSYLITSVTSSQLPVQITEVPAKLDEAVLNTRRGAWAGMEASEQFRTPLAHYHRLDSWIRPDTFNDCTRSGCHAPLPHSKKKEVRAFLNMHATSLHCGVCHMESERRPLSLVWYDLTTGSPRPAPSILEAFDMISREPSPMLDTPQGTAARDRCVDLMRRAATESDESSGLARLADHLAGLRPSSEPFIKVITAAREILPKHFRGEYGAKLAQKDAKSGMPVLGHPGTRDAVREFLERGAQADPARREAMLKAVHPLKREKPLHCTDCHTAEGTLLDFGAVGYPKARSEALINPVVFRMIEHINSGRPMHLPEMGKPVRAVTSHPADQKK